jgi:hypothetical protein
MKPENINDLLIIPEWDKTSAIKIKEAQFIYDFIEKNDIIDTLETGLGFARSASYIIAATDNMHIAMDPFQDIFENIGLKNIERLGMTKKLDFRSDYSHNVLPALLLEGRKFNFIFIDGDHKFDGMFLDFYYSDLLVKNGGYILFHDTWMRSTRLVERYIKTNRSDYMQIKTSLRNFSLFKKVGEDKRDGMYFKEFYTMNSIFLHSLIRWMTTGKDNFIKKSLMKIKDIVK